jgi:putative spermidine/putrescine transport system ATP-binding protein
MGDNRVQQVGPPLEVYRRPVNRFVADFIGINNFLPARVRADGELEVMGRALARPTPQGVSGEATLSIRPEDVHLHTRPPDRPAFEGRVSFVRDVGRLVETLVMVGDQEVAVIGAPPLDEGTEVWLELPPDAGTVLTS